MSDFLPVDWEQKKLSELSSVITKGTTPTTNGFSYEASGIKFLRVENISPSGYLVDRDIKFISEEAHCSLKRSQLQSGDLLVSIAGAIGRAALVDEGNLPANTNQAVGIVRLCDNVDKKYVRYSLQSPLTWRQITDSQAGNAQVNLNLQQLGDLVVSEPPLPEQKKIAVILSSVDDVIEKTQAQIDKLNDLKTGMMQELLTKGIGPDGKPHTEFKDSPVGRIPVDWDVKKLVSCVSVKHGFQFREEHFAEDGVPVVKIGTLSHGNEIKLSGTTKVPRRNFRNVDDFLIQDSAVLMALTGATLGKVSIFPKNQLALQNYRVGNFIPVEGLIDNMYLFWLMQSDYVQYFIENLVNEAAQPNIGKSDLELMLVPVPKIEEQMKISSVLNSLRIRINKVDKKLHEIKLLKKALMQDLLTGKVRVNADDAEEAAVS